jgi:Holliday junction resolvase RusA-like endonuclease
VTQTMPLVLGLRLIEQIPSGKNSVLILRNGQRAPRKRFREWRDAAWRELLVQLGEHRRALPLTEPVHLEVSYAARDRRRRDVPGMLDALLHLLERAEVIQDDAQVTGVSWVPAPETQVPCVMMEIRSEVSHAG